MPVKTPKGNALAHFLIDNGPENDLQWVCFLDDSGECWTYNNRMIRAQKNITQGRENISPFYNPEDGELPKEDLLRPITCLYCNGRHFEDETIQSFIELNGRMVMFTHEAEVCQDCRRSFAKSQQMNDLLRKYRGKTNDGH